MKRIYRNKSVITGKKNLEKIYEIKNFPVLIGVTKEPQRKDLLSTMGFYICKNTGIVQLNPVLDPSIIYKEYHSEALGGIWREHHEEFVKFLSKYSPSNVLEIGGSNGELAKSYIRNNKIEKWTIVEPNPAVKETKKIKVISKMFDKKIKLNSKYEAIVHSHTLEHSYFPFEFLSKANRVLVPGGLQILTLPNLSAYLKEKQSNVLNFEHNIFLAEYFLEELLRMSGFKVLEKKYFKKHSIFYATKKVSSKSTPYKGENNYKEIKQLFIDYFDYYVKTINKFNTKIEKYDGEVYLFGAHVFSQFLLSLGLSLNIKFVLDNSKLKQNKRLYGTSFLVKSPKIVVGKKCAVILRAGQYQKEIESQLLEFNPKIEIWK